MGSKNSKKKISPQTQKKFESKPPPLVSPYSNEGFVQNKGTNYVSFEENQQPSPLMPIYSEDEYVPLNEATGKTGTSNEEQLHDYFGELQARAMSNRRGNYNIKKTI